MPSQVLYPSCPVCGQNIRSFNWLEQIGERPVSIACITTFDRRSMTHRPLALGERAPDGTVVIVGYRNRARYPAIRRDASGMEAPDGWRERLGRALERAYRALVKGKGKSEEGDLGLDDPGLSRDEFRERAQAYLAEAEAGISAAEDELEFRRKEVTALATRFD